MRYLDYCSEMLALIGIQAALQARGGDDEIVLEAIDAVENLVTGISQKVWQKMLIINGIASSI